MEQADDGLELNTAEELPDDDLDTSIDDESEDESTEEVEVTFGESEGDGDTESDDDETPVITAMRKREREKDKELRKAKRELEQLRAAQQQAAPTPTVMPKPTLESCGWDETELEQKMVEWLEQSKSAERAKSEQEQATQAKIKTYQDQAKAIRAKDFKESEDEVATMFDPTRQSILLEGVDNPAMLVYALGKNPAQLERLSKITNLAKFAVELGKLEKEMKVSTKSKPVPVDTALRGSGPTSGGNSKKLAQLEAEAARTGNRTALIAYKKSLSK